MIAPLAHVGGGVFEPLQLAAALPALAAYWVRAGRWRARAAQAAPGGWRLRPRHRLILAALVSPVAHIGGELVLAHMAQHVLMADLAALLLVLGLTGPLLQPVLATPVARGCACSPTRWSPFGLWAVDLYVWHLPALYQAALARGAVHALQHTSFVFFGFTMWLALLGPLPQPAWFGNGAKLGYIVAVRLTGALLGNVFIWSGSVFYPDYRPGERAGT